MARPPRPMGSIVDSGLMQGGPEAGALAQEVEIMEPQNFEGGAEIIPDAEGGAIVQAIAEATGMDIDEMIEHDSNLAEYLDEEVLKDISNDLRGSFEDDLESRDEWEETYTKGLDLLGVQSTERSVPFEGASGVTHPLIAESVTQFQSQAYKELLPSGGPVKTKVLGLSNQETESQAARVKNFMNYLLLEKMEEFDPDMDQMLFYLPLSGSTFKKVYYDEAKGRPVSKFVAAQDVVVPYTATDLVTSPRITHVLKMTDNEVRKLQVSGMYRDMELGDAGDAEDDSVVQKVDELQGISRTYKDEIRNILEIHSVMDIEGFEDKDEQGELTGIKIPYIVTIDKSSGDVLSIRRNFAESDPLKQAIQYFVHYKFMPGLGFYGFGLTHMIGGLGRAATSILRQLIDAGTLANLPAGFKARGVRVRNSDDPLQPGEWRDIDVPGGDIRSAITPLPYKEPSGTLAQLLAALIEGGRRFISVADEQVNNMNQETPVGTTVAMLERGMKVMSAIHKRLHYAQKNEFRILARIIAENLPPFYPYQVAGASPEIKQQDFDGRVDILPVSDPNIFSMAQRVSLAQSQLQLAQSNPEMHNLYTSYQRMYQALEVQNIDEILPPIPEPQPMDPAIENARALSGQLLQAFPDQNHDAHIMAHMIFMKTPLVQTSPQVMGTFYAHLQEHLNFKATNQAVQEAQDIMQQVQLLAQSGGISPEQAQQEIADIQAGLQNPSALANYVAEISAKMMEEIVAQLIPPPNDPMADPLVQIRMQELQLKRDDIEKDNEVDNARLLMEAAKMEQRSATDAARLEVQEEIADDRNEVNRERIQVQRDAMEARNRGR
jgi:hypothetical protein|tara:strand:- start:50 stop:2545 length:2496 start_codon:yes stop_codon:yes gene_type:complete